jgi:hypothetical protein
MNDGRIEASAQCPATPGRCVLCHMASSAPGPGRHLYVGSQVVPGTPEAVRWLRAQGLTVRFTTNTDSIPSRARRPPGPARPPMTSWSPDRDRRPAVRRRGRWRWRRRGARAAGQLPGRAGRAGHPRLVADLSYRASYDELAADIGGGQAIGAAAVLVRSGKGDRAPARRRGRAGRGRRQPGRPARTAPRLNGVDRRRGGSSGRDADGH